MKIRIDRESEATIREQIREQIVYLIATGNLEPGESLPSVRSLARRLKIHPNTVSQAYQDLVGDWLVRRHGARMVVRPCGEAAIPSDVQSLDDVINIAIQTSHQRGYTLRQLRQRFLERLDDQYSDHLLVVGREKGLRLLLREELKEALSLHVESCSPAELVSHPEVTVGALIVMTPGIVQEVMPHIPQKRISLSLTFSTAEEHLQRIRQLKEPSMIAVVSISERFLAASRGLLAPLLGDVHSLREYLVPLESGTDLSAYKIVFCDSIASRHVNARNVVRYRLIPSTTLEEILAAVQSQ